MPKTMSLRFSSKRRGTKNAKDIELKQGGQMEGWMDTQKQILNGMY